MVQTAGAEERIDWVIEAGVKILETAGRSPAPFRQQIKGAGLIHIHKCARVRDAVKMDREGVDIVSVVGTECGGHLALSSAIASSISRIRCLSMADILFPFKQLFHLVFFLLPFFISLIYHQPPGLQ